MRVCFWVFFLSLNSNGQSFCQKWFENAGLKKDENCIIQCGIAETDMGTFQCPEQCPSLCRSPNTERFIFNISYLYGLTPAERALSAKYPKKMMLAYKLTWDTKGLCSKLFKTSVTNDESDACRHFIWAGLLYKKFGFELSQQILNAHEHDKNQPLREKAMDLANNRLGLATAIELSKDNKLNKKSLLESFQKNLKQRSLVIIKPIKKEAKK